MHSPHLKKNWKKIFQTPRFFGETSGDSDKTKFFIHSTMQHSSYLRNIISHILVLLIVSHVTDAVFYLPGVSPRDFGYGDVVEVMVNKIDSVRTQLPYRYYDLNFCKPDKIHNKEENLGETLSGEDIETAPVRFKMFKNEK